MEILKSSSPNSYLLNFKNISVGLNTEDKKLDVGLFTDKKERANSEVKVFDSPGEYEVKNCMIDAIDLEQNNVAFSIFADDIRVGFIGKLEGQLTDNQVESFAAVDILLLPIVGEKAAITNKVVTQIEPKIIIVHSFKDDDLKGFISEFGKDSEKLTKLKVTSKELIDSDQQRLIIIE